MSFSVDKRLRIAMDKLAMPSEQQLALLQHMTTDKGPSGHFALQLQHLDACIASMRNGRARWRANRRPVYEAYLALLLKTRAHITAVKRGTPEAPDPTREEIARSYARVNAEREAQGKQPLGAHGSHWSSWIPPHVVAATELMFEQLYASPEEKKSPGRRVQPFSTIDQRATLRKRWLQLQEHAQVFVTQYKESRDLHGATDAGMPPVERERYRAAHQVVIRIAAQIKHIQGGTPVPLKWTDMLSEDERARLRKFEKEAGGDGYTRSPLLPEIGPALSEDEELAQYEDPLNLPGTRSHGVPGLPEFRGPDDEPTSDAAIAAGKWFELQDKG